jgi:hypothetical protein
MAGRCLINLVSKPENRSPASPGRAVRLTSERPGHVLLIKKHETRAISLNLKTVLVADLAGRCCFDPELVANY